MSSDLVILLKIQELDIHIQQLTDEIENLPKHIASLEEKLATHKQQLADSQESLKINHVEYQKLDGGITDYKGKISHLLDQMNGAKTNEQYHAFQKEINFCKAKIDGLENQALGKMEDAEKLQEHVNTAETELKIETKKVAEEVKQATARIADDRKTREARILQRQEASAQANADSLAFYERIRRVKRMAMARVDGQKCGSCQVRLRPQFLQNLRHLESGILSCENCGLILYNQITAKESADTDAEVPGAMRISSV